MKRIVDFVAASLGIVVLAPLLLSVGIAILASSGSPVLFCQNRLGRTGRVFTLIKFRTMTTAQGSEKGSFDAGNTSRITPLGRFLRKTKLDELPQLWNVVKGDMSLVGPRPEVKKWVDAYPERWAFVHRVRPGITDPASIAFRNEEEILTGSADPEKAYREDILPRKLDLYEQYVRTQTFWGDIRIILKTVWVVVWPRAKG